jgi:BirA family biotin operon repressor/biotin-[acetyl-CoA-carboxylase] ligase
VTDIVLNPRAQSWVREVCSYTSVTSTNDVLKDAARRGAPEGTIAIAQTQTAGRGRHGRAWTSAEGNLFLSLLVRPRLEVVSLLPLAAGLAVVEALDVFGASGRLKWPNDVLVGERKLAGILAEAASDAGGIESVVVGVGVNVNLDPAAMPEDIRDTATSLLHETGRRHEVSAVASAVLGCWVRWYDALREDPERVRHAWRERAVEWWGRVVEVSSAGQPLRGIARGIDASGALLLETDDGRTVPVLSGEARLLRRIAP